jgi:hypothetical protein
VSDIRTGVAIISSPSLSPFHPGIQARARQSPGLEPGTPDFIPTFISLNSWELGVKFGKFERKIEGLSDGKRYPVG